VGSVRRRHNGLEGPRRNRGLSRGHNNTDQRASAERKLPLSHRITLSPLTILALVAASTISICPCDSTSAFRPFRSYRAGIEARVTLVRSELIPSESLRGSRNAHRNWSMESHQLMESRSRTKHSSRNTYGLCTKFSPQWHKGIRHV
jgi:hypothetical protein